MLVFSPHFWLLHNSICIYAFSNAFIQSIIHICHRANDMMLLLFHSFAVFSNKM